METTLNELLYNQKDICDIFRESGAEAALTAILHRREQLIAAADRESAEKSFSDKMQKKFLTLLNRNLYHYVLFVMPPAQETCSYHSFAMGGSGRGNLCCSVFREYACKILERYTPYIHPDELQNKHIEDACRYIREHLDEELSLEIVASQIYVSRCHLCQLFRSCKNINFSDYVTEERMKRAKDLLSTDTLPIDLVADRCGFSTSSYFSTVFKKKEGVTPREYRKSASARANLPRTNLPRSSIL